MVSSASGLYPYDASDAKLATLINLNHLFDAFVLRHCPGAAGPKRADDDPIHDLRHNDALVTKASKLASSQQDVGAHRRPHDSSPDQRREGVGAHH
jgi:hypothetical protein